MPSSNAYDKAITAAKKRLNTALETVAASALAISEKHNKPLTTVCKDIDPDAWSAIRARALRIKNARDNTTPESHQTKASSARKAKSRVKQGVSAASVEDIADIMKNNPEVAKKVAQAARLAESEEEHRQKSTDDPAYVATREAEAAAQAKGHHWLTITTRLGQARKEVRAAVAEFDQHDPYTDGERQDVLQHIADIREGLNTIEVGLVGANVDWDAYLVNLEGER